MAKGRCVGGLRTTAWHPKEARSITRGWARVSRWCGEIFASAEDEPADKKSDNDVKTVGSNLGNKTGGGPKSVRSGFSTATTEVAFSNY